MCKYLSVALCMPLLVGLVACGEKVEKTVRPPPPKVEAKVAAPAEPQPTTAEMVSAMLRGHPNARQLCIDGVRDRSFFLDYGPLLPPGAESDGRNHGWLLIEKVDFHRTSNNTWFIASQDENKYIQVYPDVTGLTCKPQ